MKEKLLEICVDSLASARAACRGGADRLELCSCLIAGGLSPDTVLLEQIKENTDIPVRCLMRPRAGDFLYESEEIDMLCRQIERLRSAGADGFVIGCLLPDGRADIKSMSRLARAAAGRGLTMHRAIDVSADGRECARAAADMGIDCILTSGQKISCWEGREYIRELLEEKLPLTVMAGAGVNADVIRKMRGIMDINAFHMSGKKVLKSKMSFRREGVPMGLPGLDEFSIWQTDENSVREAAAALRGE